MNVLLKDKVSDHSTIIIDLNKKVAKSKVEYKTRLVNYSTEKFIENLSRVDWSRCYRMNANEKANYVCDNIKVCIIEFIKKVSINENNDKEWYNNTLRELKRKTKVSYQKALYSELVND